MAGITPEVIDRLHANLLTSGVQQQNQALFFVIDQLINAVRQSLSNVQALTGGGGGGGGGILGQSFLTMDPDSATLPNSAQFVTHNLNINRSGNKFTVNAPIPYPRDGEDGEMGMIGPPGIQGIPGIGLTGPPGPPGMDGYCEGCCPSLPFGNLSGEEQFDFYAEGVWTPILTCENPGDLSVTYITNEGTWLRLGNYVYLTFHIITSNMTQTTATGNVEITGLPFTSRSSPASTYHTGGLMQFQGLTKAGYTAFAPRIGPGVTLIDILAGGSGVAAAQVIITDLTTGAGNLMFIGSIMMTI